MSFFKKLFGGAQTGKSESGAGRVLGEEDYQGYLVRALEMKAGAEFQLCGEIELPGEGDDESRVHKFIRADRLTSAEQAKSAALAKGRQIIDEQGKTLFSQ